MKTEISIDPWGGKRLSQLLVLFVAFALVPLVLHAEDWRLLKRRDKNDPTGVWYLRLPKDPINREFFLIVFHQGGTLTGDFQGESGFDPRAVFLPPGDQNFVNNVISSPLSGVWQKTGRNTIAVMFVDIEYHNAIRDNGNGLPDVSILQFAKFQFTGTLSRSGDEMTFTNARLTHYDPEGKETSHEDSINGAGTRIPLEILPNTSPTLPLPPPQ
jgi:hypothetical protein